MKRFIIRLLLVAMPFMLAFPYPMIKFMQGECYGDMNMLGTVFFDVEYRKVYEYFDKTMDFPRTTDNISGEVHTFSTEGSDPSVEKVCTSTRESGTSAEKGKETLSEDSTVLVIGDSFSQQGTRSFICYLQREMLEWSIVNIRTLPDGNNWKYVHQSCCGGEGKLLFFEMTDLVTYLLKHAERLPKTIIMESGEMLFVQRMLQTRLNIDDSMLQPFTEATSVRLAMTQQNRSAFTYSMNPADAFEYANKWVRKAVGMGRRTLHQKLDEQYFTCRGHEDDLYFYSQQVKPLKEEEIIQMNAVKKAMIDLAEKRGVRLIFLICPDKFDLYRKHVADLNPKYDVPSLFDYLDDNHFVPTKKLLEAELDKGVKDLYFCNDTHWSHIAARTVARELKRIIENNEDSSAKQLSEY